MGQEETPPVEPPVEAPVRCPRWATEWARQMPIGMVAEQVEKNVINVECLDETTKAGVKEILRK